MHPYRRAAIPRRRSGVTLIEVLVVMFIIGVLAALVLVAVNRSRDKARRTTCLSNLRQIGMAMTAFASQNGVLPNSGTFENSRDFFARNGGPPSGNSLMWGAPISGWGVDLLPFIERDQVLDKWDFTKPFFDPGWPVGQIPANQQPTADSNFVLSQTPIALYVCPDDETIAPDQGNMSYAVNGGFSPFWHKPCNGWDLGQGDWLDWNGDGVGPPDCRNAYEFTAAENKRAGRDRFAAKNLGLLFPGTPRHNTPQDAPRRLSTVRDGTANTILVAENFHVGYARYTWSWAGDFGGPKSGWANADPRFAAFRASDDVCPGGDCNQVDWDLANSDDARDNLHGLPEKINGANDYDLRSGLGNIWPYASSRHTGGVNVVFCDGHGQFLDEEIDGKTYAQLISPAASLLARDWPAYQPILDEQDF